MQQGVVKFFREDKGYGFIERDQGGDLFVHISEVDENFDTLAKGRGAGYRLKRAPAGGPASSRQETSTVIEASVERVRRYG